jgi:hypothetical protein
MSSLIHWHERLRAQHTGYILNFFTIVCMQFKHVNLSHFVHEGEIVLARISTQDMVFRFWHLYPPRVQLSYLIVDLIIWWGTRGFINDFRKKLNLAPIAYFSTYHGSISHLPTGYMWSPHLMPKPKGILILLYLTLWSSLFISYEFEIDCSHL